MIVTFGDQPPVFAKPKEADSYSASSCMPQPMPGNAYPPYPTGGSSMPGFGGFPPYPPTSNAQYQYNTPYPSAFPPYPAAATNFIPSPFNNSLPAGGTGTIKDEHIRESLLSAIQDKLMRRMKEQFQQSQAELDTLKRTEDELKVGKAKLDSILTKLEKEKVTSYCTSTTTIE